MKLALISDIHANLEALIAVIKDLETQRVDEVICLGDVVGYGANPCECLHGVEQLCGQILLGNHEFAVLGRMGSGQMNAMAQKALDWTREQLTDRELSMIAEFELSSRRDDILLVHASPLEPEKWHYILAPEQAVLAFGATDAAITFYGHTHLPTIFSEGGEAGARMKVGHDFEPLDESRYLVNVGSVGQPRDNDPRACYVIYDNSEHTVTYRRVGYDIKRAQTKMSVAQMPQMLIERLEVGR